jgi:hypothetical protein
MVDPDEMPEEMEFSPQEHRYVLLRSVPTRLYAIMLAEALRNEGIPTILQSEDIGIMLGNYGTAPFLPVKVLVPASRRHRASLIANRIAGPM